MPWSAPLRSLAPLGPDSGHGLREASGRPLFAITLSAGGHGDEVTAPRGIEYPERVRHRLVNTRRTGPRPTRGA